MPGQHEVVRLARSLCTFMVRMLVPKVSRRSIAESAMKNAKISYEIDGHRYSDDDWSKIMYIADQLEAVI